jgi:uncharacterized protein
MMRAAVNRQQVAAFVALAFAISWAIWLAMIAGSMSIDTTIGLVLNVIATAGPTIAAVILAVALSGDEPRRLRDTFSLSLVAPGWLATALLLPMAMIGVAIAISVVVFGAPTPSVTGGTLGAIAFEFVRVLFLGGPLEEELGWRGYALPRLQLGRTAFSASVLLGLVWGLWHIPLYFVDGTGQQETAATTGAEFAIGAFVVWTIGLSILFTWLFNQTGGSLIVVILFHAAVNLGAFVPAAVGSVGAASFIYAFVTWVVALGVASRWGHENLASRPRAVAAV